MRCLKRARIGACVLAWVVTACGGGSKTHQEDAAVVVSPPAGDLPCDVAAVVEQHCVMCHGTMLQAGAPVHLQHASDFAAEREGTTVGQIALMLVRSPVRTMPPPPNPRISDAELATLQAFVSGGALPVENGCAVPDLPPDTTTMTPGTTTMAPGTMMTPGTTMTPGAMTTPDMKADGGSVATQMPDSGADTAGASWSMFGYDLTNSRNNAAEHTLSPENVSTLHMVWQWTGAATTSTPAIVDGVVYLPAWDGKVYALHAQDGSPVWTATLPNLIDSSPSVSADLVFVSDNKGWVHAIDRATGDVKWSVQVDKHAEAHVWSSPAFIADPGIVVVGVASGEEALSAPYTFRGSVVALNASDGTEKWRFYTTDNDSKSGPGISVWGTVAVDTTRKVLYVGTGNNYSEPAGPYEDSMLAIDYTTGQLVWSHQFATNDIFTVSNFGGGPDSDIGASANLFSLDGEDYIGIGVKNGQYYVLDRDTGMIEHMSPLTDGSVLGGVISASAYADGVAFVASNRYSEGLTDTCAVDVRDGHVIWRQTTTNITYGAVAHANGVVYVGTTDKTVYALDGTSGDVLWMTDAPDSIAGGPAVSGGRLFVPWGYQWTLGRGEAGSGGLLVFGL